MRQQQLPAHVADLSPCTPLVPPIRAEHGSKPSHGRTSTSRQSLHMLMQLTFTLFAALCSLSWCSHLLLLICTGMVEGQRRQLVLTLCAQACPVRAQDEAAAHVADGEFQNLQLARKWLAVRPA